MIPNVISKSIWVRAPYDPASFACDINVEPQEPYELKLPPPPKSKFMSMFTLGRCLCGCSICRHCHYVCRVIGNDVDGDWIYVDGGE